MAPRHMIIEGAGFKENNMKLKSKYIIDRDKDHNYTVVLNDVKRIVPGVTGILDIVGSKDKLNRLMGWAKKNCLLKAAEHIRTFMGKQLVVDEAWIESVRKSAWKRDKEMLKAAGNLGTRCHIAIDAFIQGKTPILDKDTQQSYDNFIQWLNGAGIKIIMGDTYVANMELGYGGAMDALGQTNKGEFVLLDWKTSNYMQDVYALQAAAYALAFSETIGISVSKAIVIRFGKEKSGDIEPREVNLPWAIINWTNALKLHKSMKQKIWRN